MDNQYPPPPPVERKNTLPIILGGALLLLWIIGGFYYFSTKNSKPAAVTGQSNPSPSPFIIGKDQPTPDPTLTADWKSYTNTKYGFSLEYPSDYRTECSVCKTDSDFYTTNNASFVPLDDNGYGTITLFISESTEKKQVDESLQQYLARAIEIGAMDPKLTKKIQVGNTEALQTIQVNNGVESVIRTYFVHNNFIFEISFSETKSVPANMREPITSYPNINVYNHILTGFKFVNT